MSWKTITVELGKNAQLDPPNDNATVKVIPLAWLPSKTNSEVMSSMQENDKRAEQAANAARERGENPDMAMVDSQMESIKALMPVFVVSWTLKDPETEEPFPTPRQLAESGNLSKLMELPVGLLSAIVDEAMSYDMPDIKEPIPADDPDAKDAVARTIPFEKGQQSVIPFSGAGQTQ